jgi:hypothetical protein
LRKWLPRIAVVLVTGFVIFWIFFPQISKFTMLVPVEKELHAYQKEAAPVEQSLLQAYGLLEEEPTNRGNLEVVLEKSDQLLAINNQYWVEGMGPTTFDTFMYRIRGMEAPEDFLPTWPGPDDPEGLAMLSGMRSDTATLAVESWQMKDAGNAFADELLATFGDAEAVTAEALAATAPAAAKARKSVGDADFVYKRWKGNYRPPFSLRDAWGGIKTTASRSPSGRLSRPSLGPRSSS